MKKTLPQIEEIVYNIERGKANRLPQWGSVCICAVSKTQPAGTVQKLIDDGITDIGENRVQEAAAKFPLLNGARRHLIGPLQSNKENKALELFDVIQSIESLGQCRRICSKLERSGAVKSFYLQVNTSEESQKHGLRSKAEVFACAQLLLDCPYAALEGLMTLGPVEGSPRPSFQRLRALRDAIQEKTVHPLGLSMGMSGDYTIAVEEGATLLRLGTALFGARNLNT